MSNAIEVLQGSLSERWRPDDVARVALDGLPRALWTEAEVALLEKAARGSYLGTRWTEHAGRNKAFGKFAVELGVLQRLPVFAARRALRVADQAAACDAAITVLRTRLKLPGTSEEFDLRTRATGKARKRLKLGLSRRQYNKLCRVLKALLRKCARLEERTPLARMLQVAKSGLAATVDSAALAQHPVALVFAAYYTARMNRQSVFTNKSQSRAWDEVAEALAGKLKRARRAVAWDAVALAAPTAEVLALCAPRARVRLLATAYAELLKAATILAKLWATLDPDPVRMVVRRGMNSSDWNAAAGAWNALRKIWIAALAATGRLADLEKFCPGKAMRLMAADVVRWHEASGGTVDPNTRVFAALPKPWDVVLGKARCTAATVRAACAEAQLTPEASGWLAPPSGRRVEETKLTPALVHGVVVGNPALAAVLRRAGWFEGKGVAAKAVPGFRVVRDTHGAAKKVVRDRKAAAKKVAPRRRTA